MISVVIPLYNKEKHIADTIRSVLIQSFQDFEVVVVDDGSTDNSAIVVEGLLSKDDRLHLIKQANEGVCSARNKGIEVARGEFVAFLDADDQWDVDFLAEIVKMQKEFPLAALWGINFAELYGGKLVRELPTGLPKGYRGYVDNYFDMPGRVSDLFCSSSVVIRREAFAKVGLFDTRLKYSEDIDMWYRIILNYPVAFYDRYMVSYFYDADNRTMNRTHCLCDWLPYYCDKYVQYKGTRFYSWIQLWSAVRIREIYFDDASQRADARVAAAKLDYSVLPTKYKYLLRTPFWLGSVLWRIDKLKTKIFQ
ncbi:MAG: glycosyltransferase [Bacteroidales bacterium]|nr:glycosyltransferase [Bacteroidales bacterium]